MFKDVLNHMAGSTDFASIGLLIFFVVFVCVSIRALLRSKHQVEQWSCLPLAGDDQANAMGMEARHE